MTPPDPEAEALDRKRSTVFLERQGYRRRRLMDAARLLPICGGLLLILPLLWPADGAGSITMSGAIIYVFAVWIALIVAVYVFGRRTGPWSRPDDGQGMG